jgi:hypothetical protein
MNWLTNLFSWIKFNKWEELGHKNLSLSFFKDTEPQRYKSVGVILYNAEEQKEWSLDVLLTLGFVPYGVLICWPNKGDNND